MDLPGMGVAAVTLAVVGMIALVGAAVVPVRERVPRATVIAMVLITLVCLGQMALAVLQNRPAHAIGLAPLLVAGGVVLVRGARSRRSDGPVVRS
jgi:hypothetical protein